MLWFCWDGVLVTPNTPPGKQGPCKETVCSRWSWAGKHVLTVWPSILNCDPTWHFPAPGNPSQEQSLQRPWLGMGYGTPGTLGLPGCGCREASGVRSRCPNTYTTWHCSTPVSVPWPLCFCEPGGQERALLTATHTPGHKSCLSSYTLCCVTWAELRKPPSSEKHKLPIAFVVIALTLSLCIFIIGASLSTWKRHRRKAGDLRLRSSHNERTLSSDSIQA